MTKKEIIQLYISDLKNLVSGCPERDSRIADLKEELERMELSGEDE